MSSVTSLTSRRGSASPQVIEGQYLDQQKLISLLKDVYDCNDGKNHFRIELRMNRYKIYPCDHIDLRELTDVRIQLTLNTWAYGTDLKQDQIQDCRSLRRR